MQLPTPAVRARQQHALKTTTNAISVDRRYGRRREVELVGQENKQSLALLFSHLNDTEETSK
jgi:hypothetical protein